MQNWLPTLSYPILVTLWGFISSNSAAQTLNDNNEAFRYELKMDSMYQASQKWISDDSAAQKAETWTTRADLFIQINEKPIIKEKYKNIDFQEEIHNAWNKAYQLDKKNEWTKAIETGLAGSCIDLYLLGLEALENARKFKSVGDAEKAEDCFRKSYENYKRCGQQQNQVNLYWANVGHSWQWIRFFRGLSLRMAEKVTEAENEYIALIKLDWSEPIIFLELSDLQKKSGKSEESTKTLVKGQDKFPANIPIACALTINYLEADKLKQAQTTIRKFDHFLGDNPELVITKALVYEKKGDLKKADALFKALYSFDKYEVRTLVAYAGYLMRKTQNAEKMDAEEFAQLAFNLIESASDLSPNNDELKIERDAIKFKYPKVYREETL